MGSTCRDNDYLGVVTGKGNKLMAAATETAMFRALLTPAQFSADKTLDPAAVARVIADCVCGNLSITSGEVVYVHKS